MRKYYIVVIGLFCLICFYACVKPYAPTVTTTNYNYLVVEGMINLTDSTFIKLSRTVTLSSKISTKAELKATVTIESSAGASYALKELGNGLYAAAALNSSTANQYRVRIKTASGSTYASDFTAAVASPAIDSLSWQATDNLNLYVNTHDPKNATHYYRWEFNETWEFNSDYNSGYISNGTDIVPRTPAQQAYHCWGGDTSHTIYLGTSEKLSSDVINQQLINAIDPGAEKLGIKYSILVKQYGLTKDAYDYWTLLKKNNESLGGIFDSQPSASIGNIHNVNVPAEIVIGYISAGTVSTKRIFITKSQLPVNWITQPAYPITPTQCSLDTVPWRIPWGSPPPPKDPWEYRQYELIDWLQAQWYKGDSFRLVPVDIIQAPDPNSSYLIFPNYNYMAARPLCVECTLRGTNKQPSYWQ